MDPITKPAGHPVPALSPSDLAKLWQQVCHWAHELGFSQIGVCDVDLSSAEPAFVQWLAQGFEGDMHYLRAHGLKRLRPAELVPGTVRVISASMNYLPAQACQQDWRQQEWVRIHEPAQAVVSCYARGRDYHKVIRARLQRLADRLSQASTDLGYRVFCDSAPVAEVELARKSGLGWTGKHSLVLSRESGSMFFLGEIFVTVPFAPSSQVSAHCGNCQACMRVCPTAAIVQNGVVDARRCISYLTIEHQGDIPEDLRAAMGNRIYGCDDCQLVCPWNKFAQPAVLVDFDWRHGLQRASLLQLWAWDEATFMRRTEGSAMRRLGFARWQRNLAVAMGNALRLLCRPGATSDQGQQAQALQQALHAWLAGPALHGEQQALVARHVRWALAQQGQQACPLATGLTPG